MACSRYPPAQLPPPPVTYWAARRIRPVARGKRYPPWPPTAPPRNPPAAAPKPPRVDQSFRGVCPVVHSRVDRASADAVGDRRPDHLPSRQPRDVAPNTRTDTRDTRSHRRTSPRGNRRDGRTRPACPRNRCGADAARSRQQPRGHRGPGTSDSGSDKAIHPSGQRAGNQPDSSRQGHLPPVHIAGRGLLNDRVRTGTDQHHPHRPPNTGGHERAAGNHHRTPGDILPVALPPIPHRGNHTAADRSVVGLQLSVGQRTLPRRIRRIQRIIARIGIRVAIPPRTQDRRQGISRQKTANGRVIRTHPLAPGRAPRFLAQ
ncbi:hypothetical protein J2S64_000353 [Paeniglutamicibacter sulfureus]|uniref:Uncharacterized protein n=1 Tax=Paeniglutamicibacter sulfureus TaxID=43666 RepID=A0ABU2BDE3_9MICC|nr:hypothetical protein [Paeniglutamicibacter sulfureus]